MEVFYQDYGGMGPQTLSYITQLNNILSATGEEAFRRIKALWPGNAATVAPQDDCERCFGRGLVALGRARVLKDLAQMRLCPSEQVVVGIYDEHILCDCVLGGKVVR